MEKTLTELCEYLNNYFWRTKYKVNIDIVDGTFTCDFLKEGQYFRILGSDLNDGVYQYPASDMNDESFNGSIWSMAVPQSVIDLANDIERWQEKYGSVDSDAMSPFNSESFGNYSYSKDSSASGSGSVNPNSWQSVFKSRLNHWRRMRNI